MKQRLKDLPFLQFEGRTPEQESAERRSLKVGRVFILIGAVELDFLMTIPSIVLC